MESYFIGGGALLEAGERSTITRATLHAQLTGAGESAKAVLIDFESSSMASVHKLLALAPGFTAERFETTVTARLLRAGVCGFEDVAGHLASQVGAAEVHLFARWEPPAESIAALEARGVALVCHPLEEISRAALVVEHRFVTWNGRAA